MRPLAVWLLHPDHQLFFQGDDLDGLIIPRRSEQFGEAEGAAHPQGRHRRHHLEGPLLELRQLAGGEFDQPLGQLQNAVAGAGFRGKLILLHVKFAVFTEGDHRIILHVDDQAGLFAGGDAIALEDGITAGQGAFEVLVFREDQPLELGDRSHHLQLGRRRRFLFLFLFLFRLGFARLHTLVEGDAFGLDGRFGCDQ